MTHTLRSTKQEDIERYKYVSGIKDQTAYQESLYNRKKTSSLIEQQHIPFLCQKIRELVDMMKPVDNIKEITLVFDQWCTDTLSGDIATLGGLEGYLREKTFRNMLPHFTT
jgi:hypothetical protein